MNSMDKWCLDQAVEALLKFRKDRDWEQFHTPKNLSMSISIECAELMEHFQWKSGAEIEEYLKTEELAKVRDELADIASYLLLLTNDLEIDLNKAILDKVRKNDLKYPVDKSRGRHNKYDNL